MIYELVEYKGKEYFASVVDLYSPETEEILMDVKDKNPEPYSEEFKSVLTYNADYGEYLTLYCDDIKEIKGTGKYFLYLNSSYREYLLDGEALLKALEPIIQTVNPDNFLKLVDKYRKEIHLANLFNEETSLLKGRI